MSPESRLARYTGSTETSTSTAAATLTIGLWLGRNRFWKIHSGRVCRPGPAVKVVTTISSNDSANASSAPASRAPRRAGNVTRRQVVHGVAPRSIDASSTVPDIRRSRAEALLTTTTMQKVACPTTNVRNVSPPRNPVNRVFRAIPVTMPGSAIGSTTSSDTASRPKNS